MRAPGRGAALPLGTGSLQSHGLDPSGDAELIPHPPHHGTDKVSASLPGRAGTQPG